MVRRLKGVDERAEPYEEQRSLPPAWGRIGGGVDEGAGPIVTQRSPPPTWGGIGWGVDERAEPYEEQRSLPPAWGRIGGGVDERAGVEEKSTGWFVPRPQPAGRPWARSSREWR